jgi:hypothetical protein
MITNKSKTILNEEGNPVFMGLDDFLKDIAQGSCCFICGAKPETKKFNDEHVIPDWILRKYKLHGKTITLPNDTPFNYGQYTIPCCEDCNRDLGKNYEEPMSELLTKSYTEIIESVNKNPDLLKTLFIWLSLIFLKTHLKDKTLRTNRDLRKGTGYIADSYFWEDMHHIHCIARSHYTNAKIDSEVYGTLLIVPSIATLNLDGFDYIDNLEGKGIMLQLGELSIISILNDSSAALNVFMDNFKKINGAVTPFQLREILSHLVYINVNLKDRPIYYSEYIATKKQYFIRTKLPSGVFLVNENERITSIGVLLRNYAEKIMGNIDNREEMLKEIEEDRRTYLFNNEGIFLSYNKDGELNEE